MEISITPMHDIPFDSTSRYYAYTIHAGHHRILTVSTTSSKTLSRWLTDLLKSTSKTHHHHPIIVGISAETDILRYTKRINKDLPYDILTLCVGSQCLIYHLDTRDAEYDTRDFTPNKTLRDFLENPNVIAVGMDMQELADKMKCFHGINIKNALDLRALASEGFNKKMMMMKDEEDEVGLLDMARYDLDKVAVTVLGNEFEVVRPKKKVVEFYDYNELKRIWHYYSRELTLEKVKFVTIDAYLCFLVGSQSYDMIHHSSANEDRAKRKKDGKKKEMKMKIEKRWQLSN